MLTRAITGVFFIAVLVGATIYNQYSFISLFFVLTVLGLWEFYTLAKKTGHTPSTAIGLVIGSLLFLFIQLDVVQRGISEICAVFILPLFFLLFIVELYKKHDKPFGNIAFTLLGIIYIVLPFALTTFVVFYSPDCEGEVFTPERLLGVFFCLWSYDTGAYLTGRFLGKHKLFERISPKKTWEGCIGGAIASLGIAALVSYYFTSFSLVDWLIITGILIVFGTLGDLVESLFKRSIDVKDSGKILPGHGGILDRFDSFLLAMPFIVTYILLAHY